MSLYSKAVNAIVKAVQGNGEELRGIIPNSLCEEIKEEYERRKYTTFIKALDKDGYSSNTDEKIKSLISALEEIEYEIPDDILNVSEIAGEIMYIIEEKDVEFELLSDLIEARGDFSHCRYIRKTCIRYASQSSFCDRMCREYDEDSDDEDDFYDGWPDDGRCFNEDKYDLMDKLEGKYHGVYDLFMLVNELHSDW